VHTGFWWGDIRERTTWKTRCIWENNIKNKCSRGVMERHELGFCGLGYGEVAGICVCGNELSDSIKFWEIRV